MVRLAYVFLLVSAVQAFAEARTPGASDFAMGAFCALETVGEEVAEGTITGTLNLVDGPPVFYSSSAVVPAQIGVGFGIHLDVAPRFEGPAVVTTTHPPMGTEGVTRQTWQTEYAPGNLAYNGFTFEYAYELVQGAWTISASSLDGREIYHAAFTVVDPKFAPPPPCGTAPLS